MSSRTSRASSTQRKATKPHSGAEQRDGDGDRHPTHQIAQEYQQDPRSGHPRQKGQQLDRRRDLEFGSHAPHNETGKPRHRRPEKKPRHRQGEPEYQQRSPHEDVLHDRQEAVAGRHVSLPRADFGVERGVPLHFVGQPAMLLRIRPSDPIEPLREALQAWETGSQPFAPAPRHPPRLAHVELLRDLHEGPVAVVVEVERLAPDPLHDARGEPLRRGDRVCTVMLPSGRYTRPPWRSARSRPSAPAPCASR